MKRTISLLSILIILSCKEENVNGYFKKVNERSFNTEVFSTNYNINREYYRLNGDSIIVYMIKNMEIDSTLYVWEDATKEYKNIYKRTNFTQYDQITQLGFGNKRYEIIDSNHITFSFDTINGKMDESITRNVVNPSWGEYLSILKDTLERIDKKHFFFFLKKDKEKDSILFHHPYVSNSKVENAVRVFINENIEGEIYGNLISESVSINRIFDDLFKVRFKTKNKYDYIQDHFYKFDANMESWSIKRE